MKDKQRKLLLKRRGALNKGYIKRKSIAISRKISFLVGKEGGVVSYSPCYNEANPNLFLNQSRLYFPRIDRRRNGKMDFFLGSLVKSFRNIKEPFWSRNRLAEKKIKIVIVPGVGFDARGYRIGYGMGFYDRFLKKVRALKIGVTFDCCLVSRVSNSDYDVPVDVVVTEKRKIFCKLRR